MHSVAFEIGGVTIYWYGILAAAGFLAGFWTASRRAPQGGIHSERIVDLAPWLLLGAILGARLWYVAAYWQEEFAGQPIWTIFGIRRSGLVYYGGLIGASAATCIYARLKSLPLWKVADILAPSIALGHVFGRAGCLMTGCCYGKPTDLPWAIHFPAEHWTGGVGVHPTQIYESLLNLCLYGGLAWLFARKKFDGQIFAAYLVGYAILRTFVEIFPGDYPKHYIGVVTIGQISSGIVLALGALLWWWLSARRFTGTPNPEGSKS